QNRLYFHLNILALLLYTCGSFIPEVSRIGYYLTAGHIFLIPSIVKRIPHPLLKKGATILTAAAAALYFAMYLVKAQDLLVRVVPYHTWIFPGEV
ncbi:MAG: EpsG family protein, partial [Lachnospiraceae bacterium]|nr:EpsG family protein [Lachnospiraceae bacterium]